MKRRRRSGAAVALLVLVAGLVGGWLAAGLLRSPAQVEAAATAPPPKPVTAQVQAGDLAQTITARTTIGRSTHQEAQLVQVGAPAVVTGAPAGVGTSVRAGSVLTVVNDRPVLAMPGDFPLFRDIGVGDTGADVRQLQQGLREAGQRIRSRELGTFGGDTVAAVTAVYRAAGFRVPTGVLTDAPTGSDPAATTPAATTPAATTRVVVPRSEISVVRDLPAQVASAPPVGTVLGDGAKVDLVSGPLVAQASVAVSVAPQLTAGTKAVVSAPDGTSVTGTVARIVEPTVEGDPARALIVPAAEPFPETWSTQDLIATITIQTVAEGALVVPSAAVVSSGGGAYVLKQTAEGFHEVAVREVGTLDGRSAVQPTTPGTLAAGDTVQVA